MNNINQENGSVQELSSLLNEDLTKEKSIVKLCKLIPGYAKIEIDISAVESIEPSKESLQSALKTHLVSKNILEKDEKLLEAKTRYLKTRDVLKFKKHQGNGIPNPPIQLELSSPEMLKGLEIPAATDPITKFPKSFYRYHHPVTSEEGDPLEMLGIKQEDPNWSSALKYIEKEVLPHPLEKLSVDEFLTFILEIHNRLVGHEEKMRDKFSFIINPSKCDPSPRAMRDYLCQQKDGEKLEKRFNRYMQKMERWGSVERAASYITPNEWKAFQTTCFVPASPEGLNKKTKNFLEVALKLMKKKSSHPLQIAAFLHFGLTSLHPYEDANGRLSRLIANIYLMQQGYEPFFVVEDAEYTGVNNQKEYDIAFIKFLLSNWELMKVVEQNDSKQKDDCSIQ